LTSVDLNTLLQSHVSSLSPDNSSQTFISDYLLPTTDINCIAGYCNFFTPTGSM